MPTPLNDAVKLPCGLVFPNRLAKVSGQFQLLFLDIMNTDSFAGRNGRIDGRV